MSATAMNEDPELFAIRQRRAELQARKVELIRSNALSFYRPHEKQHAFHRSAASKRMIRAGNRFGKTQCGAAEDVAWLIGERPWEEPAFRKFNVPSRPVKGIVVCPDLDIVDRVWTSESGQPPGKLWHFLPRTMVRSTHTKQGTIVRVELTNGSVIHFETVKAWKNDPMSLESADWDFAHFDEPIPKEMHTSIVRGLIDRGGKQWFTLTPLREPWINDLFFPEEGGRPDEVWAIDGSIYDNPSLSPIAIKEFESGLNDEEKECRLHGKPLHLAGLVYKEFNRATHVLTKVPHGWSNYNDPPRDYSIYYSIDPHPQTPHAVLFCAVSPLGQRFYFENIFKHCSIAELAELIHPVIRNRHIIAARMDPLGFIEDPISGNTMASELARCGIYVEKATKALAQGILHVKGELKRRPATLYFSPMVQRTLWEITRYCWDERENKPIDENDHMMENLYRLELMEPKFFPRDDAAWSRRLKPLNITPGDISADVRNELREVRADLTSL
mgnify:CR=1 FL=1